MSFKNLTPQEIKDVIHETLGELLAHLPDSLVVYRKAIMDCDAAIMALGNDSQNVNLEDILKSTCNAIGGIVRMLPNELEIERAFLSAAGVIIGSGQSMPAYVKIRPMISSVIDSAMNDPGMRARVEKVEKQISNRG